MKKVFCFLAIVFIVNVSYSQILDKKSNLKKYTGYFTFYYDQNEDKIYLEVDKLNTDFLYVYSLSQGVGSNDIGLDRGQLGNEQVVYFEKAGNKLLLVQPNLKFRANSDNLLEKRSVEQAFAKSVLFGFKIEQKVGNAYLIDFTPFLLRDAHGVAKQLKSTSQGSYKLDLGKSALAMERTKAFPENSEFEAMLTFEGEATGDFIKSVAPDADLVTVVQHHSFIKLPDNGYKPREFDPRSGSFSISYMDYATPVQEPIVKRFITRHRLEKKNPELAISEAVEPIIYYLDNGTPEPVRSALLDGARWWNQAFEALGYKNAFQVKILPDDADPMDVRYNVIQWVHRSTRGWSYGASIIDPRTGEILKGHVSLGSLRIRQDFLIAQALMNKPFAERDDNYQPMLNMALARIRQLSAHEIGHTLGLAHNFAASVSDRASVMDYPHPKLAVIDSVISFENAYATGIGDWDKISIAYAYASFPEGKNEREELNKILNEAQEGNIRFITDSDSRAPGGAHPYAHLWDNGDDAASELLNVLKVRETAIKNFSEHNIRSNEPFSVLEDVFVPLYFFHRYQTEAVAKVIGGVDYSYAVKGDGQVIAKTVDEKTQRAALGAFLKTLDAKTLAIPQEKLKLFPPRAMGYERTRESFKSLNGVTFDPLSAVETAADFSLSALLHPERAFRLVQQKSINEKQLGLQEVIDSITQKTIKAKLEKGYLGEVQQAINFSVLKNLMALGAHEKAPAQVQALVNFEMMKLKTLLSAKHIDPYSILMVKEIDKYLGNPKGYKAPSAPKIPDGAPIGMDCLMNN